MQSLQQIICWQHYLDNHIQQGNALGIDPRQVVWKRCVDMNDRALQKYCSRTWYQDGRIW